MPPPAHPIAFPTVLRALWKDACLDMLKRRFEERCFLLGHLPSKIDDPLVSRTASDVLSITPRAQHLGIPPAVGVRRQLKPRACQSARHVEGTALGIAHEGDATIFSEALRFRQVQRPRSQISVDARYR